VLAFEELPGEKLDLQFGARLEHQDVSVDADGLPDRDFGGISGSIGGIWRPMEGYGMAVSLARAVRLPTATELYANGPHAATSQFEIGDPMLDEETSLGLDISLRRNVGRFRGELNLFNNEFEGYIYESPTGDEEDGSSCSRSCSAMRASATRRSPHTRIFSATASRTWTWT
jgi:iron complex outermembrane recepter protein